ncbi:hypothetical protein MHU86_25215 [Fragilaria crotonensis]|nr:hypothetical protein MHU86_25215 [Fragilaria crotonensis]
MGTPSMSATTVTTSSNRSGMSSITAQTTTASQERQVRVANTAPDAEIGSITIRPGGARRVMEEHPPPRNDANTSEMCVAWWTRGGCYPNCRRRATHQPFASAAERTRLLSYVRERLAAPAATNT